MNCKPGDLAITIGTSEFAGRLVEVLHEAPQQPFVLPDGFRAVAANPESWVIQILGSPVKALLESGDSRYTVYGVAHDAKLRPLPGLDETLKAERKEEA